MISRFVRTALIGMFAITLAGCADTAAFFANTATEFSASTPRTVNSVKLANDTFTALAHGADHYVVTAHPAPATIHVIEQFRINLKDPLDKINAANAEGQNPTYTAFNAALQAWLAYNTSKGITQ